LFFRRRLCGYRLRAWRALGVLRSLETQSTHQTFLTEEEDVNAFFKRGGVKRFCELNAPKAKITAVNRVACFIEIYWILFGPLGGRRGAAARFLAMG
jgi:hypothetical protein